MRVFYVLTAFAGKREGALALALWAAVGAILTSAVGLVSFEAMDLTAWALLIAGGLFGTCGHLLMAGAFRRAPTALVSPLVYSQIIWAMVLWLRAVRGDPDAPCAGRRPHRRRQRHRRGALRPGAI